MALDRALLDALFVASPFSVALYDLDGRLAVANAAYEAHWGIRIADVPSDWSLLSDPQLEESGILPHIRRAYEGAHVVLPPVRYDASRAALNGGLAVWTQGHCFPVRDDNNHISHLAIIFTDVTSIVEAERTLVDLASTLEERNAELSERARAVEEEREMLDRVVAQLPAAVAVMEGPELRFRTMSSAYRRIIGGRAVAGERVRDVLPDLGGEGIDYIELMEQVYHTGEPYIGMNLPASWDADGDGIVEHHHVDIAYAPLRLRDGTIAGITAIVVDVDERARLLISERIAHKAAEQAADRARLLQQLTAALNEASTLEQIADAVFSGALPAVGADGGSLMLLQVDASGTPSTFETIRSSGFDPEVEQQFRTFPVIGGQPLSDAIEWRTGVFLASADEWNARYPAVMPSPQSLGFQSFVALPIFAGDRPLAAMSLIFREARDFDDSTRLFLSTLAEQCAIALERQHLHVRELRHSEQHAALLATIQDPFIAFDESLQFTYVNPPAEQLVKRRSDELVGRTTRDVFPATENSVIEQAVREVLRTRTARQLEAYSFMAGCWVEARIYPAPGGVSLVMQDITERRRAASASAFLVEATRLLSESLDFETTLRAVASAAVPELGDWCVIDIIADPTRKEWPPQVDRVALAHADESRARQVASLNSASDVHPVSWFSSRGLATVLQTGEPLFIPEFTDAMLDDQVHDPDFRDYLKSLHLRSVIVVPMNARGLILGIMTLCMSESSRHYDASDLALAMDVAQRAGVAVDNARLYREAERARADAEAANLAKSKFLATMSHELRTPLNAIQGHVQLIQLGVHGDVNEAQRDALERVERAERHLLSLIDDVLSYARLESGRIEYDVRPTKFGDMLRDILPMIEPQFIARGVLLSTDVHAASVGKSIDVMADREKLGQVLLNLLSNALKFTQPGGTVVVSVDDDGSDTDAALIKVSDTGVGIPADKLEAIFQPFIQLRDKYAPGAGGTGLGLAISRDLARGMGGELTALSELGVGSTFVLRLRRATT
jgi:PAS domain S-box-containing protein